MKAVFFDLDGTVLNTQADIGSSCNAVLKRHGYPQHPLDAYRQMVGNGFDVLVRRALPQAKMPDACAIAAIAVEAREYYASQMMEQTQPYPGLVEALQKLVDNGITLGVLSNKPDAMTTALISHYFPEIPFACVQGALPDVPLKPDPTSLLSLLDKAGILPEERRKQVCYVGDSNVDVLTAHNADVTAIGAAWGFRGAAELVAAGADLVLADPSELARLAY